jgi:hypothetical protein
LNRCDSDRRVPVVTGVEIGSVGVIEADPMVSHVHQTVDGVLFRRIKDTRKPPTGLIADAHRSSPV